MDSENDGVGSGGGGTAVRRSVVFRVCCVMYYIVPGDVHGRGDVAPVCSWGDVRLFVCLSVCVSSGGVCLWTGD